MSLGLALGLRFQWNLAQLYMPLGLLMHCCKDYLEMDHPLGPPSPQVAATSDRVASVQTPKEWALLSLQRVPPSPMLEGADYWNSKDPARHRWADADHPRVLARSYNFQYLAHTSEGSLHSPFECHSSPRIEGEFG